LLLLIWIQAEFQCLLQVCDGLFLLSGISICHAAQEIGHSQIGLELDGLGKVGDGSAPIFLDGVSDTRLT